jgi:DNA-binding LacI/PurR family transcriptional regulator
MTMLRIKSASQQVADHLREELVRGTWSGSMPGETHLLAHLGVGRDTIKAALSLLEQEGILVSQGPSRRRRIVIPETVGSPVLRVRILLFESDDARNHYLLDIQERLMEAGHVAGFASKSLIELGMDRQRVARFIELNDADVWVICAGSREILTWCAEQPFPVLALAGRLRGIPIAGVGPNKESALRKAVRHLVDLGHRRIVMLAREMRRKPEPGRFEKSFLDELELQGIPIGQYNLPNWEESPDGLSKCLDSLFSHTPPTALIVQEMPMFIAAQQHLAQRGILAPRDVSMICSDPHVAFAWCKPTVAHLRWDSAPWSNRIVRWAHNVGRGKTDLRQSFTKTVFVDGGTIGPAVETKFQK